jgi:hypothetical protein
MGPRGWLAGCCSPKSCAGSNTMGVTQPAGAAALATHAPTDDGCKGQRHRAAPHGEVLPVGSGLVRCARCKGCLAYRLISADCCCCCSRGVPVAWHACGVEVCQIAHDGGALWQAQVAVHQERHLFVLGVCCRGGGQVYLPRGVAAERGTRRDPPPSLGTRPRHHASPC